MEQDIEPVVSALVFPGHLKTRWLCDYIYLSLMYLMFVISRELYGM